MAEILIQRRRHRSVWPWLLVLAAMAVVPLPFMAADRDDRAATGTASRRDTAMLRDTTSRHDTSAQIAGAMISPGTLAGTSGGASAGPPVGATASAGGADGRIAAAAGGSIAPTESASPSGPAPAAAAVGAAAADAASGFDRFIRSEKRTASEREYISFAAEGLRGLAQELRALGASATGVRAILANADSLERISPRRSGHADYARAAFLAAVRELDVLRGRNAAPVDTGRMRAAAWAIRPERPLEAQRGTARTFFAAARDAVLALSRSTGVRRRR